MSKLVLKIKNKKYQVDSQKETEEHQNGLKFIRDGISVYHRVSLSLSKCSLSVTPNVVKPNCSSSISFDLVNMLSIGILHKNLTNKISSSKYQSGVWSKNNSNVIFTWGGYQCTITEEKTSAYYTVKVQGTWGNGRDEMLVFMCSCILDIIHDVQDTKKKEITNNPMKIIVI